MSFSRSNWCAWAEVTRRESYFDVTCPMPPDSSIWLATVQMVVSAKDAGVIFSTYIPLLGDCGSDQFRTLSIGPAEHVRLSFVWNLNRGSLPGRGGRVRDRRSIHH